jgi:membrane-bound metal-dependent hydrolase YbcI (DUF457 family)
MTISYNTASIKAEALVTLVLLYLIEEYFNSVRLQDLTLVSLIATLSILLLDSIDTL